jgi:uncharacterized integral membrane protein
MLWLSWSKERTSKIPSYRSEEVLEMDSDPRSTQVAPAPGVIPEMAAGQMSDLPPAAPNTARAREAAAAAAASSAVPTGGAETRAEHFRRKARRGRLHGYAIAAVALVAVLIALAASNTAQVNVNWLISSSQVSLVWLVLVAGIVGWLLGLITSARLNWRTRAPRRRDRARS